MIPSAIVPQCSRLLDHIPNVNRTVSECARKCVPARDDLISAASLLSQSSLVLDLLQHELAGSNKTLLSNEGETVIVSVIERHFSVIMEFEEIVRRQNTSPNVSQWVVETQDQVRDLNLLLEIGVGALRVALQVVSLRDVQSMNTTTEAIREKVILLEQSLALLPSDNAKSSATTKLYQQFIDTMTTKACVKRFGPSQDDPPPAYESSSQTHGQTVDLAMLNKFDTLSTSLDSKLLNLGISENGTTIGAVFASGDVILWRLHQDHTSFVFWMTFKVPDDFIDSIQFLGNTLALSDAAFVVLHSSQRNVLVIYQTRTNCLRVSKSYVRNLCLVASAIDQFVYYSWDNCLFRLNGYSDFDQSEVQKFEAEILSVSANAFRAAVLCNDGMVHLVNVFGSSYGRSDGAIELMKWDFAADKLNTRLYLTTRNEVVACWTTRNPLKGHNNGTTIRLIFWNGFSSGADSLTTRVFPSNQPAEVISSASASMKYLMILDGLELKVVELNRALEVVYDQQTAQGTGLPPKAMAIRNQNWRLGKGPYHGLRDVTALLVQYRVPVPVKPSSWLENLTQSLRSETWEIADIYTVHLPGLFASLE